MRTKRHINRCGFTIVELMVSILMSILVVVAMGTVLVDSQRGFSSMYNRIHAGPTVDAYVARKAFDTTIRKSVINRPGDSGDYGNSIAVYYYRDVNSIAPDQYANFFQNNQQLQVTYGNYDWQTGDETPFSTITLADNVRLANFYVNGASVTMVLTLEDGYQRMTVTSSAIRHNLHSN